MTELTKEMLTAFLPHFDENRHKGDGGRALMAVGSYGMAGAAALAAEGAYRVGCGLVDLVLPTAIYPIVATLIPEAVYHPTDAVDEALDKRMKTASCLLVGCGFGKGEHQSAAVYLAVRSALPLVLDADGLNAVAGRIDCLKEHRGPLVLTPHPGEAARLLSTTVEAVQAGREEAAQELAARSGGVAVLKGHRTLIATADGLFCCPFGNAGMAKGGSGDILAGMIAGLLAQGLSARDSALLAVGLHALAGDEAAHSFSPVAMMPRDILRSLPAVLKNLLER